MKYNSKILICMALFSTLFLGLKLLEKNKNRRCQKPRYSRALEKTLRHPGPEKKKKKQEDEGADMNLHKTAFSEDGAILGYRF